MKRPSVGQPLGRPPSPTGENHHRLLQEGMQYHQQGQLLQAENCYQRLLHQVAKQPDALHLLGLIRHQQGRHGEAVTLLSQAIGVCRTNPLFFFNLAKVYISLAELAKAAVAYRQAIALQPAMGEAYTGLARILLEQGDLQASQKELHLAMKLNDQDPISHNLQGLLHKRQGNLAAAVESFQRACQLRHPFLEAINNLGITLRQQGNPLAALPVLQQAASLMANHPDIWGNLGHVLMDLARWQQAVDCFAKAHTLQRDNLEWLLFLTLAHLEKGDLSQVEPLYQRLLAATEPADGTRQDIPQRLKFHLAQLHLRLRNDMLAADHFSRLAEVSPDPSSALVGKAKALCRAGLVQEAIQTVDLLLQQQDEAALHSYRLNLLNYVEEDAALLLQEHTRWQKHFPRPLASPLDRQISPLRLGYVSPDFRRHSVSQFFLPVLSQHDRQKFAIHLYAHLPHPDAVSTTMQGMADVWREIHLLSDQEAAEIIDQDGVEILVDLAGHSADNRLGVFLHRPAPIQVTWLGYPNSSGLAAMDYRISDWLADPAGLGEKGHSETLLRLPNAFFCYQPPDHAPEPSPPPALHNGYITFASFNNLAKVTPLVIETWAAILRRLPNAVLALQANTRMSETIRRRLDLAFEQWGVKPGQVIYQDMMPFSDYLCFHAQVDILLDTFPWNGHTVTCHALWMGVPLITMAGQRHASRMGASLLHQLGFAHWVAKDRQDYIEKAVELAENRSTLASLRQELRSRFKNSPLLDAESFTQHLENLYLSIHADHLAVVTSGVLP